MRYLTLVFAAGAIIAACGDPFGLPDAFIKNEVDTVSLYALSGTPISQPSGFSILARSPVRTEQGLGFDFAFDIDSLGQAKLLPTAVLKMDRQFGKSGLQISALDFDSILIAPTSRYQRDSAVIVTENSVVIAHSFPVACSFSQVANYNYYAKLHVLTIDTTSGPNGRRIDFEILTDINCGYRGLEPNVPRR